MTDTITIEKSHLSMVHHGLLEMTSFAENLLSSAEGSEEIASRAGHLHMAIMFAFHNMGLLKLACVPHLSIEVAGRKFEVSA